MYLFAGFDLQILGGTSIINSSTLMVSIIVVLYTQVDWYNRPDISTVHWRKPLTEDLATLNHLYYQEG